jgi:small subunit ribosomal protein S6
MIQHEYELVTIFRPDMDDAAMAVDVERIQDTITENGGTLLILDDWGKRKLAYPVRKHLKGHYMLFNFLSAPTIILELERNLRIIESVIRFLTSKVGDSVDADVRIEQAAEQRQRMSEEAARLQAEAEARAAREEEARVAAAALEAEAVARAEAAAAEATAEFTAVGVDAGEDAEAAEDQSDSEGAEAAPKEAPEAAAEADEDLAAAKEETAATEEAVDSEDAAEADEDVAAAKDETAATEAKTN